MKELNRYEMAAVKRTAQNVKHFKATKEKLEAKLTKLQADLADINESIEVWENPIRQMANGLTSTEVLALNGIIPTAEDIQVPENDGVPPMMEDMNVEND